MFDYQELLGYSNFFTLEIFSSCSKDKEKQNFQEEISTRDKDTGVTSQVGATKSEEKSGLTKVHGLHCETNQFDLSDQHYCKNYYNSHKKHVLGILSSGRQTS